MKHIDETRRQEELAERMHALFEAHGRSLTEQFVAETGGNAMNPEGQMAFGFYTNCTNV